MELKDKRLRNRDINTLKALYENKVMSKAQLLKVVYSHKENGEKRESTNYLARRLTTLSRFGFIHRIKSPFSFELLYIISSKGVRTLSNIDASISDKARAYRPKTYEIPHTLKLVDLRILFSERGISKEWVCERFIRSTIGLNPLDRDSIPDALFQNNKGEWVALEYEKARKDRKRYEVKLSRLMELIRSPLDEKIPIKSAIFLCEYPQVHRQIDSLAMPYSPFIKAQLLDNFLRELEPNHV